MKQSNISNIADCLDALLPRKGLVLTFDQSFVDQLPDILRENFAVCDEGDIARLPALQSLFQYLVPDSPGAWKLSQLPELLVTAGIDRAAYRPLAPKLVTKENESVFSHWSTSTVVEDTQAVLTLQRDLGMGQHNRESARYSKRREGSDSLRFYLRNVTTVPPSILQRLTRRSFWELWIAFWKFRGLLNTKRPSLSVGPRWVTEIEFFREVVGLRQHIGLDLFSDDPELVKAGDMHAMPFPDRQFQFIFIKNTIDKSYNVRKLVDELVRVVCPGGIIVVDQICGYGHCTPLTRTDIQKSENLLRLFRARAKIRTLVQADVELRLLRRAIVTDRSTNNARLAFQVL
jgi:SAM-dependent methyltransferase